MNRAINTDQKFAHPTFGEALERIILLTDIMNRDDFGMTDDSVDEDLAENAFSEKRQTDNTDILTVAFLKSF